ncbi:MAG TPA: dihydrofolate reductase family protein [Acidothermales bacterium]
MSQLTFDISMSLDGFVAGPNPRTEAPLGDGGERLHEWAYDLESFHERHNVPGGTRNQDADVLAEAMDTIGAEIMGRGMFGGGPGPWDESWTGWWGDDPPFRMPVFVLTHHPHEPLQMQGGTTFTFVTDGIESALEQARAAAGGKDVGIGGGADVIQQYLRAGLVDKFQVHIAPILLGSGTRLFDAVGSDQPSLEITRVVNSPAVTHVRYRVAR